MQAAIGRAHGGNQEGLLDRSIGSRCGAARGGRPRQYAVRGLPHHQADLSGHAVPSECDGRRYPEMGTERGVPPRQPCRREELGEERPSRFLHPLPRSWPTCSVRPGFPRGHGFRAELDCRGQGTSDGQRGCQVESDATLGGCRELARSTRRLAIHHGYRSRSSRSNAQCLHRGFLERRRICSLLALTALHDMWTRPHVGFRFFLPAGTRMTATETPCVDDAACAAAAVGFDERKWGQISGRCGACHADMPGWGLMGPALAEGGLAEPRIEHASAFSSIRGSN